MITAKLLVGKLLMNNYEQNKKVRRVDAVIFIIVMTLITGGSYLAQQQKEKNPGDDSTSLNTYAASDDPMSEKPQRNAVSSKKFAYQAK